MELCQFTFNLFQEKTSVIRKDGAAECIVVDPGYYTDAERKEFFDFLQRESTRPAAILLTHAHLDHIFGVKDLQDSFGGIPVYMNPEEEQIFGYVRDTAVKLGFKEPDTSFRYTAVAEGQTVQAAGFSFEVITTPGHTPGGVCYYEQEEKFVFTGDTLFAGTIGRTDFLLSDYDVEIRSVMEKLMALPSETEIIPGHGGTSTIGYEGTNNPFLEPFNEPIPEEAGEN